MLHVLCVLCFSSDELGLDDVMDIELDFPDLPVVLDAPASLTTHSLSLEVISTFVSRILTVSIKSELFKNIY